MESKLIKDSSRKFVQFERTQTQDWYRAKIGTWQCLLGAKLLNSTKYKFHILLRTFLKKIVRSSDPIQTLLSTMNELILD